MPTAAPSSDYSAGASTVVPTAAASTTASPTLAPMLIVEWSVSFSLSKEVEVGICQMRRQTEGAKKTVERVEDNSAQLRDLREG